MESQETLLHVRQITKRYRMREKAFVALKNVDFNVVDHEFLALVGPSGCGKSTLLRLITGLEKPSSGEIVYRGELVRGVNPKTTVVFQTFALFPWLTVQQNVELALEARGIPKKIRTLRSVELLDMVGLDGFETAFPRELSGGMRQKVGFARALAVEPELLCLDEPFSTLDILSAETLRSELHELWVSKRLPIRAIILVTHNIEEAAMLADRIVVMDKEPGRVIADIPIELSFPRSRKSPDFLAAVDRVYATLAGHTQQRQAAPTEPGAQGRAKMLPIISIDVLIGLMQRMGDAPEVGADIYRLATELNIPADEMLHLTEAAELLGLAEIRQGDIVLTPLGDTFAEASMLVKKEIFSRRVRRLPMFKWLWDMFSQTEHKKLEWEDIRMALEEDLPPDEAQKQLDAAVEWGRYAELLSYDDNTGVIFLEKFNAAL
ncbi:MAG: AAA-associated domain-containing protein [Deltaproteobacteria bacterium]|nr:AAA-associated domain-containing protein [Deltaproteobacteria bacterium]